MMEIDCLARPRFESYELPSQERKVAEAAAEPATIVLISDRLQRLTPIRLAQQLYRMTGQEHSLMKRALMASVRIRNRLQRD